MHKIRHKGNAPSGALLVEGAKGKGLGSALVIALARRVEFLRERRTETIEGLDSSTVRPKPTGLDERIGVPQDVLGGEDDAVQVGSLQAVARPTGQADGGERRSVVAAHANPEIVDATCGHGPLVAEVIDLAQGGPEELPSYQEISLCDEGDLIRDISGDGQRLLQSGGVSGVKGLTL